MCELAEELCRRKHAITPAIYRCTSRLVVNIPIEMACIYRRDGNRWNDKTCGNTFKAAVQKGMSLNADQRKFIKVVAPLKNQILSYTRLIKRGNIACTPRFIEHLSKQKMVRYTANPCSSAMSQWTPMESNPAASGIPPKPARHGAAT